MNQHTGAFRSTDHAARTPSRRPAAATAPRLAIALLAVAATATAGEDPGAEAARPCGTCHDRGHFEGLNWETYRAGLVEHPALDGVVADLSEADRHAIARHFGIPGTPDAGVDPTGDPGRR
ncbi:MAG: hypothetical protein V2J02_02985 [Pseudomonadales bacterium]|jgi:cytochrome c553|nr:hypothetical protein [Pseudomonadales bacterium]